MGTNYYFFTKNKKLAKEYFPWVNDLMDRPDDGAVLTDNPDFGYEIHLNKLSYGWKPLLQRHPKAFTTFKKLEEFYHAHEDDLKIYDEYNREYTFEEYKEELISHSKVESIPVKWVYEINELFPRTDGKPSLEIKKCKPEEADLFTPFDHIKYGETEKAARKKYKVPLDYWESEMYYDNDPDYDFDWTSGEFC